MLFRLFENIYGNRFSQNNKSFITIYGIRMNKQRNGKNVDRKKERKSKSVESWWSEKSPSTFTWWPFPSRRPMRISIGTLKVQNRISSLSVSLLQTIFVEKTFFAFWNYDISFEIQDKIDSMVISKGSYCLN